MPDPANNAQNASTGMGPGAQAPTSDSGAAPAGAPAAAGTPGADNTPAQPPPPKLAADVFAEGTKLKQMFEKLQATLGETVQEVGDLSESHQKYAIALNDMEKASKKFQNTRLKLDQIEQEKAKLEKEWAKRFKEAQEAGVIDMSSLERQRKRELDDMQEKHTKQQVAFLQDRQEYETATRQAKILDEAMKKNHKAIVLAIAQKLREGTITQETAKELMALNGVLFDAKEHVEKAFGATIKAMESHTEAIDKNKNAHIEEMKERRLAFSRATAADERAKKVDDELLAMAKSGKGVIGAEERAGIVSEKVGQQVLRYAAKVGGEGGGKGMGEEEQSALREVLAAIQLNSEYSRDQLRTNKEQIAKWKAALEGFADVDKMIEQALTQTKAGEAAFAITVGDVVMKFPSMQADLQDNYDKSLQQERQRIEEEIRKSQESLPLGARMTQEAITKMALADSRYRLFERDAKKKFEQQVEENNTEQAFLLNKIAAQAGGQAKPADFKLAEKEAEAALVVPKWASDLITAYKSSIGVFQEEFGKLSDMFGGSTTFTKMLMIAAFMIGAVVGYIWSYIKKVYDVLSGSYKAFRFLTAVVERFFGRDAARLVFSIGSKIGDIFKGAGGFLGKIFGPVGNVLKNMFGPVLNLFRGAGSGLSAIGNAVPWFGKIFGFLPKIMGAFQLGFKWASALFPPLFAIINIITAIVGAFRGFGQGGIKGAIIGAIAQLLSGLTFGIMDFQKMFDFLNSTLGPLFDAIIDLVMFAYNTMIKPFVDMFKNIFAIWTGGGGIFTKLAKTIFEVGIAALKFAVGRFLMFFVQLPIFLMKGVFYVLKFFFYDIPKMIVDGIAWLWNWITSGDWLSDINNFGSWMLGKLQEFWDWVLNSVADAIESLPWIGPKIAKGMRPSKDADTKVIEDSVSKPLKKAVEMSSVQRSSAAQAQAAFAGNQTNYATYKPTGTQPQIVANAGRVVTPSGVPIQSPMATSVATVEAARMQAQAATRQPPTTATVQVNNSQVSAGGGGGTPLIPLGPNRNPDPTYRALLFMEAPAL